MIGYYFITDSALSRAGNAADVLSALEAGVSYIQFRGKSGSTRELRAEAGRLAELCRGRAKFIVNDRLDIALSVGADGVHVGQDDLSCAECRQLLGKGRIVGVTVHSPEEAVRAKEEGADYLGVSPIFSTKTKPDAGKPVGLELLRRVKELTELPVVAIGGIDLSNAPDVVAAGADGLCAISAVITREDPAGQMRRFQELFK